MMKTLMTIGNNPVVVLLSSLFVAWEAILEVLGVKYSHGDASIEITKDNV